MKKIIIAPISTNNPQAQTNYTHELNEAEAFRPCMWDGEVNGKDEPGDYFGFVNVVNDPRVRYMMRPSPNGTYNGIIAGQFTDNTSTPAASDKRVPSFWGTLAQTSAPALGVDTGARTFFRNDSKFPIMTYSEMQFLSAEAYFRKGDLTNARTAYINGINGHFDMLNTHFYGYLNAVGTNSPTVMTNVPISASDRAAYLADPTFVPLSSGLTLKHIMCQMRKTV